MGDVPRSPAPDLHGVVNLHALSLTSGAPADNVVGLAEPGGKGLEIG